MTNEFRHKDVVAGEISENEYEAINQHVANNQAVNDMLYFNGTCWVRATPATIIALLAHKTSHQDAGADEISVTGLSGLLANDQHVLDAEVLAVAEASGAVATHAALATGIHNVGASTVASIANIATHAALTTGVHGASSNYLAYVRTTGQTQVARTATLVVAASDAFALSKSQADYVCDGTADQVEINAALAALPASGGEVVLSEGNFAIAASITPATNSKIRGQGMATKLTGAAGISIFDLNNKDDVKISDMWLYGAGSSDLTSGLVWIQGGSVRITVKDVKIEATEWGMLIDSGGSTDILVEGCLFTDIGDVGGATGYGIITAGLRVQIINNRFVSVRRHAVYFTGSASHSGSYSVCSGNQIYDNDFIAITTGAVSGQPANEHIAISNNVINNTPKGVYLGDLAGYITIVGNTIKDVTQGIYLEGQNSFDMTKLPYHVAILGNVIDTCAYGVVILGGSYISIAGNTVKGATTSGIEITYAGNRCVDHVSIYGNTLNGNGGGNGIRLDAFSNTRHVLHDGNVISGFTNAISYVDGAAAPTKGFWQKGDKLLNYAPASAGPWMWICVFRWDTTISATEAAGQTVLSVTDAPVAGGVAVNDKIGIVLDTGAIHWSYVTARADGSPNTITINDVLPSQADTPNVVYVFRFVASGNLA